MSACLLVCGFSSAHTLRLSAHNAAAAMLPFLLVLEGMPTCPCHSQPSPPVLRATSTSGPCPQRPPPSALTLTCIFSHFLYCHHHRYADSYRKKPTDTAPFSKTGGGYWITQRTLPHSPPFLATTTYRAEVLQGPETAEKQLEKSVGLRCTLPQYEAARKT